MHSFDFGVQLGQMDRKNYIKLKYQQLQNTSVMSGLKSSNQLISTSNLNSVSLTNLSSLSLCKEQREETPDWYDELSFTQNCNFLPTTSSNTKDRQQFPRNLTKSLQLERKQHGNWAHGGNHQYCKYHNKKLQYICLKCRQIQCRLCECLICQNSNQSLSQVSSRPDNLTNLHQNLHKIVSLDKFIAILKQETRNRPSTKYYQANLQKYVYKLNQNKQYLSSKLAQFKNMTKQMMQQLKSCYRKFQQAVSYETIEAQNFYSQKIQLHKQMIQFSKTVDKIFESRSQQAMIIVLDKWAIIADKVGINWSIGPQKQLFQLSNNRNCGRQNNFENYSKRIFQSAGKLDKQIKSLNILIVKSQQNLMYSRASKLKQINVAKLKNQGHSVSHFSDHKTSKSSFANKKVGERITLTQMKKKFARQSTGSITNSINRQIKLIRKQKQKSVGKGKKQQNQVQRIQMYGGSRNSMLSQSYTPWKVDNQLRTNQLGDRKLLKQLSPHTGFGFISNQHPKPDKNIKKQSDLITIGGIINNNQVSDCIFRVDFVKKKRELIGRLSQPMAYFGFASFSHTHSYSSSIYLCGGLNQHKQAMSSFQRLQFSQFSSPSLLHRCQLEPMDQPKHSLTLTQHREHLYAIGGIDSHNRVLRTVTRYCQKQKSWSHYSELCYERAHHSTVSLKSGLYVIGGWNGQNYMRSVQRLEQSKQIFQVVMEIKEPRGSFGVMPCVQNNAIIILGGKNVNQLSSCQYLSIKNKSSCFLKSLKNPKSDFICF